MIRKVSYSFLKRQHACRGARMTFKRLFGDEANVSLANARRASGLFLRHPAWISGNVLNGNYNFDAFVFNQKIKLDAGTTTMAKAREAIAREFVRLAREPNARLSS